MKQTVDPINELFDLNDEGYLNLGQIIYQRDYTADALSFLANHSRILNYWGDGEYDLLPENTTSGRRKFSFLDLIWLGIVKELRDFGLEKENIYTLKKELLDTSDSVELVKLLHTNRQEVEQSLREQLGANTLQVKAIVEELLQKQHSLSELNFNRLYHLAMTALVKKEPVYLLVNKEGSHCPLVEKSFTGLLSVPSFTNFFRSPHLSICLNHIISFFLSKDYIKDNLKQSLFSKQEWQIIELIRKERPQSVTIYFNDGGEPESFEVTKKVYVALEARLSEIMARGGYEKLEVVTQNGKPIYAKKTKKMKP